MLENREFVVLAIDSDMGTVVGFVNAVSDSVLWACIPLLEVLPQYRSMGIGKELLTRLLAKLGGFYMIDLVCDKALESFYGECGMVPASEHHCAAMMLRNYECQSGRREGKSEPDRMR
jgi:predicted N-acetyltransferase YhbS